MENEKKFFVYVDYRKDDGKPFYVGKGITKRIKNLERNPLHANIKNKHGIIREIVFETHSEQESFEKEIQLIGELQTYVHYGKVEQILLSEEKVVQDTNSLKNKVKR
jgi:hypothetical protein